MEQKIIIHNIYYNNIFLHLIKLYMIYIIYHIIIILLTNIQKLDKGNHII